MNPQRLVIALTLINAAILLVILGNSGVVSAQGDLATIRGRALEIVDARGQVRARIDIEPEVEAADGTVYPESVVFRMTDPSGRIRVKLGADQGGSGLLLANDSQQPGVHILAKSGASSMRLINSDGHEKTIAP